MDTIVIKDVKLYNFFTFFYFLNVTVTVVYLAIHHPMVASSLEKEMLPLPFRRKISALENKSSFEENETYFMYIK
jgi:hypothetical protein